ncbi:MAG TPA: hypothetical protein VND65_18155 [Candidatus Binatia bacterium]|nr:hypothetical protein [Candidatus Binatia bacterium]
MNRYIVRCQQNGEFMIVGTFAGANEQEALDASAVDRGEPDFQTLLQKRGLTRDNHRVELVKE